jgi:hypothetical protein
MPVISYARNERIYLQHESAYGQIRQSGGIATVAGGNCCSVISCELDPVVDLYDSEYKTGSRSIIPGQAGRKVGTFRLSLPLKGSGTPGTPPDYATILLTALGSQTINAGVSVVYSIIDNPATTFSLFRYRLPATLFQQIGISCIPTSMTFNLGQNMANWSVSGDCFWVLDQDQFSTADSFAQAGLTAFPVEPISPVTNGVQAQGFVGSLIVDGNTLINIQSLSITASLGWSQNRTYFGTRYPTDVLGGIRRITASMNCFDDDSSAMKDLRAKGLSKAPMTINATVGNNAGNSHNVVLQNCQLPFPGLQDTADRFALNFSGIVAHESSPGSADEIQITLT